MKRLYLMRHAKSSWAEPGLEDWERPLNQRGREAATLLGRYLKDRGACLDVAICSAAARTMETLERLLEAYPGPVTGYSDQSLYLCSGRHLVIALAALPEKTREVLVVAHFPGVQEAALALAGSGTVGQNINRLRKKFPTGAIATLEIDSDSWDASGWRKTKLTDFVTPKTLRRCKPKSPS